MHPAILDEIALDASRAVMRLEAGPVPPSQYQARVQVIVLDAIKRALAERGAESAR